MTPKICGKLRRELRGARTTHKLSFAPVMGGFGGHRTANDRRRSAWGRPCIHPVARLGGRTGARRARRDPGELKPGKPRGWRHPLHARPGDRAWTNVRSDRASRLRLFRAAREFRTGTEILDAPCRDDKRPRGAWDHASGQRKLAAYTSRRAFRAPRPPVSREGSYSITDGLRPVRPGTRARQPSNNPEPECGTGIAPLRVETTPRPDSAPVRAQIVANAGRRLPA